MSENPSPAQRWLAQWRAAGPALAEVRRRELRALTDEEALRAADALLSLAESMPLASERQTTSGLVAQQALFHGRRER